MEVKVKLLNEKAKLPKYMTNGDAGMDLSACLESEVTILPGEVFAVPTGLALAIPIGYEAQLRPRSGLALKNTISLPNSPGTIDSEYRGEVKVIIINHGKEKFTIKNGDRIAQMVFNKVEQASLVVVEELDNTERGAGGFGHTGIQ